MGAPTTEIDLSGFGLERLQHIGRGQYANAQLVQEKSTGATYVAKCISLAALNEHDQDLAHQEVFLLQTLSHPYIVAYRDSFLIEGANTLVIVMEHCDGGDLRKAIKEKAKRGENFSEEQVMSWFVQLCLALQYIHSEKVLHRDLKTSNIFLTEGGSVIKLGDFGISRVLEGTTEAAVTIVGTPYYMSPEVCRSEPYNWKSDIWALGCVLYELCMLKHAFESSSLLGLVYKIVSDHYEPIPPIYSPELNTLISKLLMKNAEQRPSINEIFANSYVKAYLAKQSMPAPVAPPAQEHPPVGHGGKRVGPSLRPVGSHQRPGHAQQAQAPPQAPGPPPVGAESSPLVIIARIRRRLVGRKLNWISTCAAFDSDGDGALSPEAMHDALFSMNLGLSEDEMSYLIGALAAVGADGKISLDDFSERLRETPLEVQQVETWARQILAPAGSRLRDLLRAQDAAKSGTLPPPVFMAVLKELVPVLTAPQQELLALLADKNGLGDIDYGEFLNTFGPPTAPPSLPPMAQGPAGLPPLPAAPPGMPPLPGGCSPKAAPAPPGMPPLPGAGFKKEPVVDLAATFGTLSQIDVNMENTFFTCTSQNFPGNATTTRVSLSPQGCALIFGRIRRRLEAAHLNLHDCLVLFTAPGEKEITAEQWLDVASHLPLGISRAEMQQLFSKVDPEGTGKVPFTVLETGISRAQTADCCTAPGFISAAMQRGLCARISQELDRVSAPTESGHKLAREADFRRVVMQSERYLTADQLNSILLLADKSAAGLIDYEEFAERFGEGASPGSPMRLRSPGGVSAVSGAPVAAPAGVPSQEELAVVGARTAAVLEQHGLSPDRIPALLALFGGEELPADAIGNILASLPMSLSQLEAQALLQATGGLPRLAAWLEELRSQGVWKSRTDWAASCIPGAALRAVLQGQVIEAESRTLEPADFCRVLADAGVAAGNIQPAMWMAEKTAQGDVRVAEFLANFGGMQPQAQKKRGMLWRMMGR